MHATRGQTRADVGTWQPVYMWSVYSTSRRLLILIKFKAPDALNLLANLIHCT